MWPKEYGTEQADRELESAAVRLLRLVCLSLQNHPDDRLFILEVNLAIFASITYCKPFFLLELLIFHEQITDRNIFLNLFPANFLWKDKHFMLHIFQIYRGIRKTFRFFSVEFFPLLYKVFIGFIHYLADNQDIYYSLVINILILISSLK